MTRVPVLTRDGTWIADDWSVIRDDSCRCEPKRSGSAAFDAYI